MAKYYVLCDDDCRYEGMTREQILAAIEQALEQGHVSDPESAVFSKIREIRANATAQIWVGTEAQFNALSPAPSVGRSVVRMGTDGVLYLCTDDSTLEESNHNHTADQVNGLVDLIYPIGSIYMSVNNINPSNIFKGTAWEQIKDVFLLAAGDKYAAGSVGGEADHTLTIDEIPSHNHPPFNGEGWATVEVNRNGTASRTEVSRSSSSGRETFTTDADATPSEIQWPYYGGNSGGGIAHNNMPPYIAVYMWRRIAVHEVSGDNDGGVTYIGMSVTHDGRGNVVVG